MAMRQGFRTRIVLAVLAAAIAFCATPLVSGAASPNPFDLSVRPVQTGDVLPSVLVVDQRGQHFDLAATRGETMVIGFIYTSCKDECPVITQKFGRLDAMLGPGPYRLVEVTIDPVHDTQAALAVYARTHGVRSPRWQIVTGQPEALDRFVRAAGVSVIDNGRGELVHGTRLLLVGADGRVADVDELAAWDPASVAARLQDLAGRRSSPLAQADFALTKTIAQFCGGSYQVASGIMDVVAVVLLVAAGAGVALWLGRRVFAQGA
ncbi:MAG: SCO family protein [Candidatus Eremiobacteraeota bacterium]|nr:SCO family protein [Candidatus Eremiobacteraeota bacterium]